MTKRNIILHSLTELQQAILDFLWEAGSGTAEQVREALMPEHPLKDSSVRTLLRRLEAHGYLKHRMEGKVFVYEAAVAQRSVAARAVANIIHRFCSGSAEQFLLGMVDEKVLSADEIRSLARKIRKSK
jgi:BlaI family transcriptional regulator, penicillinase repressor